MMIGQQYLRNELDASAVEALHYDLSQELARVEQAGLKNNEFGSVRFFKRNLLDYATKGAVNNSADRVGDGIELRYWLDIHVERFRSDRRFNTNLRSAYLNNWYRAVRWSADPKHNIFKYNISYFLLAHLLTVVNTVYATMSLDQIADLSAMFGWEQIAEPSETIWIPRLVIPTEGYERAKNKQERIQWVTTVTQFFKAYSNDELAKSLFGIIEKEHAGTVSIDAKYMTPVGVNPVCFDQLTLIEAHANRKKDCTPDQGLSLTFGPKAPAHTLTFFINERHGA